MPMKTAHRGLTIGMVTAMISLATPSSAQDLEPRAYSSSPVGLNFLVATVGRSTGGVLVDQSLPFENPTRLGTDFDTLLVAWQYAWVD